MIRGNDWYEQWFDTPYYSMLYGDHDEIEAEHFLTNLLRFLQIPKKSKILDLACGAGRHSYYLHHLGYPVIGADLSPTQIRRAKNFSEPGLDFRIHDMRAPIDESDFDLILNLFTSFGYFRTKQEDQQTVKSISEGLQKGGRFVLDFLNMEKALANLVLSDERVINGIEFKMERSVEDGFLYKRIRVIDEGNSHHYYERLRTLYLKDFEQYFNKAGLMIKNIFGDYELGTFDRSNSDRLILYAEKD